jgi:hypothetical protein
MSVTIIQQASHLFTADDTSEVQQKRRFGLRKPLFYPLNYGNNLERINGLNGDGQMLLRCAAVF